MQIYNTLTRKKEEFNPLEKNKVIIYVCGLTPYDHIHMGHARTYIAFDVLKRYLIKKGNRVLHIQNVTDVEDKIIKRARKIKTDPLKLARKYQGEAEELLGKLGVLPAQVYPYVSEHIKEISDMVQAIMDNGYAYKTSDGIYYRVRKFKDYGKLSGQNIDKIISGARINVNEDKEDPIDFALWKFKERNDQPSFETPLGWGRPGWHIECSAMSLKYSGGRTLDIHGGARDLIFPHHENEIAQSESATRKKFVNYWMHTGYLTVNGEKMSKSLGNFVTLLDALKKFSPEAIRYFFTIVHYRSPVDYDEKSINDAQKSIDKIKNALRLLDEIEMKNKDESDSEKANMLKKVEEFRNEFYGHLENDLDTPSAAATLMGLIHFININVSSNKFDKATSIESKKLMNDMLFVFGLDSMKINEDSIEAKKDKLMDIANKLGLGLELKINPNPDLDFKGNNTTIDILNLILKLRNKYRKEKNWKESDKIRDMLKSIGINLSDENGKSRWYL